MPSFDLADVIDKSACYCLNEHPNHALENVFMGDESLYLSSDCDGMSSHCFLAKLSLSICRGVIIAHCVPTTSQATFHPHLRAPWRYIRHTDVSPLNNVVAATAPRVTKLYINRPNMAFSDVDDVEPTQTLELSQTNGPMELRVVKFQQTHWLTVGCLQSVNQHFSDLHRFISNPTTATSKRLSLVFSSSVRTATSKNYTSFSLSGEQIAGTNMKELKKVEHEWYNRSLFTNKAHILLQRIFIQHRLLLDTVFYSITWYSLQLNPALYSEPYSRFLRESLCLSRSNCNQFFLFFLNRWGRTDVLAASIWLSTGIPRNCFRL